MALDYHALGEVASAGYGAPQATTDIVSNTDRRDVSETLDLLSYSDTPFISRIGWGAEVGATKIEWLTENLGPGYVVVGSAMASDGTSLLITTCDNMSLSQSAMQLQTGTVLYGYSSTDGEHALLLVASTGVTGELTIEVISTVADVTTAISAIAADKLYILGAVANEGSLPRTGNWRTRALASNSFTILRRDVQITGSEAATDFYAIGKEEQHQIRMRMLELTREREKQALYANKVTRSTTVAGMMNGCLGFLLSQSGDHINITTTTLTESAVNDVIAACWERGSKNLTWFSALSQARKFTQWDVNRIRMAPRDERGGGHVAYYMSEAGVEIEIVAMPTVPTNIAFLIDTTKVRMRAKKGRKGIMEKLGKMGDFERYQIVSEFTLEMRGYNQGQHGLFTRLS